MVGAERRIRVVDKHERFVALAEKRVNRAIDDLRLIGNLSSRNNYTYSEEEARKIIHALESELRRLKKRFASGDVDSRPVFKL